MLTNLFSLSVKKEEMRVFRLHVKFIAAFENLQAIEDEQTPEYKSNG